MGNNDFIDIRRAKFAKQGLRDLCEYIGKFLNLKKSIILEIGSFAGQSADIFSDYFGKVVAIDVWQSGYDPTGVDKASDPKFYNMKKVEAQFDALCLKKRNIKKQKSSSEEAVKCFEDLSLDTVYIDGNHNYKPVREDILRWLPKVKLGGFICGHDYNSKHFPGVRKAVNETLGEPVATFRDSSWVVRKNE
jgi:hypothetical protein